MEINSERLTPLRLAYSADEVAKRLGISVRKIRQELRDGRLGYARIGRRILITELQLSTYLNSRSVGCFDALSEAKSVLTNSRAGKK